MSEVETEVSSVNARQGDRFALCSDGLCGVVRDPEIASVLATETPDEAARVLVERANQYGGPDNITVQIATVA